MSYTYHDRDLKLLFKKDGSNEIYLPKNKGIMRAKKLDINQDIFVLKNKIYAHDDVEIEFKNMDLDLVFINYAVEGNMQFASSNLNKSFSHKKNQSSLFLSNNSKGYTSYKKNSNFFSVNIALSKDFVQKNAPNLLKSKSQFMQYKTNPKIQILSHEVFNSSFSEDLEHLYIQSKIYELIYLEFIALDEKKYKQKILFSSKDKEALHYAKEILENSYQHPPTITELAKQVALNEFKLKHGFKRFFETTPHKVSLNSRLYKAKELLSKSELNISEISQQVGFKHIQNFTIAFIKHFGIRPKDVRKNRSTYY